MSFADRHVKLLEKYPQAQLVVVGSGEPDDWQAAKARVGGGALHLSLVDAAQRSLAARVLRSGESLAQQWRETLGIRVRVVQLEAGHYQGEDANAVLDGWIADYPDPQNFLEAILTIPAAHVLSDEVAFGRRTFGHGGL